MEIRGIEVPNSLIRSARERRLVVFVGAGVSRAEPSGLPGFQQLADEIAKGTGARRKVLSEEAGASSMEPFDRFLGRLEKEYRVDVHQRARQALLPEGSVHNHMHQAVIGLFPEDAPLRIVTTNFDLHLEGGLEGTPHEGAEIYRAPALPLGNAFQGVVYLHGRLDPDPRQMVLTDRDFGRAYLTEGWARRFLRQLFAAHDVLFVGYGHNDPVVSYLARGLPPDSERQRFALSEAGRADHWQLLDIKPIEYPNPNADHAGSGEVLIALGDLLCRGAASHEQDVREIVRQGVDNLRADGRDYLLFILGEPNLRHLFFDAALKPEWMLWMEDLEQLTPLLEPLAEDHRLIQWFVTDLLEERGETALAILGRKPYRFTSRLLQIAIARELVHDLETQATNGLSDKPLRRLTLWISIYSSLERLDQDAARFLGYLLKSLPVTSETRSIHLLVFQLITRPYAELKSRPSGGLSSRHSAELVISHSAEHHTAEDVWKHHSAHLEALAEPLVPILTGHFLVAHRLQSGGQTGSRLDSLSFRRSAIEPNKQDFHHEVTDVLVDAARICLEHLNRHEAQKARKVIETWIQAEAFLLRRLAVYSMQGNSALSIPQKVALILSVPSLLSDSYAHHEVFHTLRHCYEEGSPAVRKRILAAKRRALRNRYRYQPDRSDQDPEALRIMKARSWITFLTWLGNTESDCTILADALEKARTRHPELEPKTEHADFTVWFQSGFEKAVSPLTPDEVRKLSPQQLVARRKSLAEQPRKSFGINEARGLDESVQQISGDDFAWGMKLGHHLAAIGETSEDLWSALFHAWSSSEMEEDELGQLMSFLLGQPSLVQRERQKMAALLKERFGSNKTAVDAQSLHKATMLAIGLWPLLDDSYRVFLDNDDLFFEVINNPLGHLGLFAIGALSRQRTDFNRSLDDAPDLEHLLNLITADADGERGLGAVALAAQLPFLMAVAPEWTNEHLIPLLDWDRNEKTARAIWTGYFRSMRLPQLTDSFRNGLARSFSSIQSFGETTRRLIPEYVVALLNTDPNPLASPWLTAFLLGSTDADRALMWRMTRSSLRERQDEKEENSFDAMWEKWGRELIERRLTGGPDLEEKEWEAIVELVPELDAFFAAGVDLLERRPRAPTLGHGPDIFFRLDSDDNRWKLAHLWNHPNDLCRYLLYFISALESPVYWLSDLRKVLTKLQELKGANETLLARLSDRYIELGGRKRDLKGRS